MKGSRLSVFFAVVFILGRFAWRPIISSLKAREDSIEDALKAAELAKEEMSKITGGLMPQGLTGLKIPGLFFFFLYRCKNLLIFLLSLVQRIFYKMLADEN